MSFCIIIIYFSVYLYVLFNFMLTCHFLMFLRFQFSLGDGIEISSQRSSLNASHATKRQKLEAGYFSNVC